MTRTRPRHVIVKNRDHHSFDINIENDQDAYMSGSENDILFENDFDILVPCSNKRDTSDLSTKSITIGTGWNIFNNIGFLRSRI